MDEKAMAKFLVEFHATHDRFAGDLVGLANGLVRLQERKAVIKCDFKRVLPLAVRNVFET